MNNLKLGKAPAKHDTRTLKLDNYTSHLAPAPTSCNLTGKMQDIGMMLNDKIGDCTCATVGHIIQQWTAEANKQCLLSDDDILSLYEKVGGYVPGDDNTDNGAVVLDVLNYWRQNGLKGHKLQAYATIKPSRIQEIKDAVYYFGSAYVGVQLPLSAQDQDIWDVSNGPEGEPGSWGGHAIPIVAYDDTHLYCITWGAIKKMTYFFFAKYCDEAYALLSADWICDATHRCPSGFDLSSLQCDLHAITSV